MKKAFIIFTFVTFSSLIILSCNTECDEPQLIVDSRLDNSMPYIGNEILRFLDKNLDTQSFVGQGILPYWTIENGDDTRCTRKYKCLSLEFINLTTSDKIKIKYECEPSRYYNSYFYYFFFNEYNFGSRNISLANPDPIYLNNYWYNNIHYYYDSDTTKYLVFRKEETGYNGIIKIKVAENDILTLIR